MKLYDCSTAPNPRRVRMFLAEKGVQLETVQIDLAKGEQLSDAFREINPGLTVPVLELDDGTRLCDSTSISQYLEEIFPEPNLMGRNATERAVTAMWQRDVDVNGLGAVTECFRNSAKGLANRALTGPIGYEQIPALADRGRLRVRQFYQALDRRLGVSEYIAGDRFTIADITAFVTLDFARAIKEPVPDEAVHLVRWRAAIRARPSSQQ